MGVGYWLVHGLAVPKPWLEENYTVSRVDFDFESSEFASSSEEEPEAPEGEPEAPDGPPRKLPRTEESSPKKPRPYHNVPYGSTGIMVEIGGRTLAVFSLFGKYLIPYDCVYISVGRDAEQAGDVPEYLEQVVSPIKDQTKLRTLMLVA